ncbi:G5 domain-containing protein [Candidatus Saccharibacteria bacterium]|nr:G5 domain-containing protein [Candidatus Saccharibacteria bacterium]
MRLSRKIDQALSFVVAISLIVIFGVLIGLTARNTFAEGDGTQDSYLAEGAKFVTFYDDGQKLTVKTDAETVKEAIERADIVINDGDIVEPGLETEINADNFFINIYRARPVVVEDGKTTKYVMTASRDFKTIAKEAGLALYDGDEVELAPNTNFLEAGVANVYRITRNGGRTLTVEEEIAFTERAERDYSLPFGTSEVRQLGEVGVKKITYNVQYINNEEVSRELVAEEMIKAPVERIVAVGAKKSVPPEWETCASWARQAGVSESELSAALDLIYHESGCRVDAANASGAYGIPQALPGSKMASIASDWETNPVTQIRWMIGYVNGRYGGWTQALNHWYTHGWY